MDLEPVVSYRNLIKNITKIIANKQGTFIDLNTFDNDIKDIVTFEVELDQVSLSFNLIYFYQLKCNF